MPDTIAAIDVGTNSFHLVVAELTGDGGFDILTNEKIGVRLGRGGGDMKLLSEDAIDRGVETLTRMRKIADTYEAGVRAVATSAVREANNAAVFIERAKSDAGIDIEVVSGVEEARLIHLGVLQALPVYGERHLVFDIGGGSTEVIVADGEDPLLARSFKLGAVRLTDRFFRSSKIKGREVEECRAFCRSTFAAFERDVASVGFDIAAASSGTAESIMRMCHLVSGGEPLRTYNRTRCSADTVREAVDRITSARTLDERAELPGVDTARADIIVAGALIFEAVLDSFRIKEVTFSEYALREGILLDTIARQDGGVLHHLRDTSRQSVLHLAARCDTDVAHSTHVAELALQLFDQTSLIHARGVEAREYLEAAALLANVGLVIGHSRHHLHSYYVIRNAEQLSGFTDHEIEIIAQIARYHRKSAPKPSHAEFTSLEHDDQQLVRLLAGILRIAIGLDRSHNQAVSSVRTTREGGLLFIDAATDPEIDIDLELYSANDRSSLLGGVLGLGVEVRRAS